MHASIQRNTHSFGKYSDIGTHKYLSTTHARTHTSIHTHTHLLMKKVIFDVLILYHPSTPILLCIKAAVAFDWRQTGWGQVTMVTVSETIPFNLLTYIIYLYIYIYIYIYIYKSERERERERIFSPQTMTCNEQKRLANCKRYFDSNGEEGKKILPIITAEQQ